MAKASLLADLLRTMFRRPGESARNLTRLTEMARGSQFTRQWKAGANTSPAQSSPLESTEPNPLREYFDGVKEGPGVWKWVHYFDAYHRHLQRFVGTPMTLVEVGVYSGGSMPMWRRYFGDRCTVHGVDIQPECKAYENAYTTIHIGDQADRAFWKDLRNKVPCVDVLIDDGGHDPEQQMVTLEEMLPHVRPGGVFICEDVHGIGNRFAAFAHSLASELNANNGDPQRVDATPFQSAVESVHLYPYMVVIEKRAAPIATLSAPKHGTEWQPFL